MFTLDSVLRNYALGEQTRRVFHKNSKEPDYFQDRNGNGLYVYDPSQRTTDLNSYYSMAFANYWKRGVEKKMQAQGMTTSPEAIVIEMAKSLDALNYICGSIIYSQGTGINLSAMRGTISLPYADMFLETFSQSKVRFETLFHAISENANSNIALNESNCKNGLITFTVKQPDSTLTKQGVWETNEASVSPQLHK